MRIKWDDVASVAFIGINVFYLQHIYKINNRVYKIERRANYIEKTVDRFVEAVLNPTSKFYDDKFGDQLLEDKWEEVLKK